MSACAKSGVKLMIPGEIVYGDGDIEPQRRRASG